MVNYFDAKFKCNENFLLANLLAYSYKFCDENSSYYNNANLNETRDIKEFMDIAKRYPAIYSLVNYADEFDKQTDNESRNKLANNMMKKLSKIAVAENDEQLVSFEGNEVKEAFDKLKETNFFKTMLNNTIEHKDTLESKFNKYKQIANETIETILRNINPKKIDTLVLPPQLFDDPYAIQTQGKRVTTIADYPEYFNASNENLDVISMMHEIMHTYIPVNENLKFKNTIQEDIYKVINHCLVELSSNGELGKKIGKLENSFGTPMHQEILKNRKNGEILKRQDYIKAGISFPEEFRFESSTQGFKDDKVVTGKDELSNDKIRGIVYPYFLAFKNKGKSIENILTDISKDKKALTEIYGKDFFDKIENPNYLKKVMEKVKEVENIIDLNDIIAKDSFKLEFEMYEKTENNNEQKNNLTFKQKIAHFLQKNNLFMNMTFIDKFVQRQLDVLPESQRTTRENSVNSIRNNFVKGLKNFKSEMELPQVQRMSEHQIIEKMKRNDDGR